MKIELELSLEDRQAIAREVVELIRPYVTVNGKLDADNTFFDVKGLAEYLKVDESWVYKQVSLNSLPFFKIGKYTRFKKSAIDQWIETQTFRPVTAISCLRKGR